MHCYRVSHTCALSFSEFLIRNRFNVEMISDRCSAHIFVSAAAERMNENIKSISYQKPRVDTLLPLQMAMHGLT